MCSARAADVQYRLRPLCRSREIYRDRTGRGWDLALIQILPSSFVPSLLRQERLSASCGMTPPIARRACGTAETGGIRLQYRLTTTGRGLLKP